MMGRRAAWRRRVVNGLIVIVVFARHAWINFAPIFRMARRADAGGVGAPQAQKTYPSNRLRAPRATAIGDIDRSKTTKGRHMAREPRPGAKAPAFTLGRDDGSNVSLRDFKGRNLVLYFYPKADTPGCTKEAIAFSSLRAAFAKTGTDVLGVSADPVAAQGKFKSKHKLKIALGSDESKKMLQAYGAWGEKSMYGRKFMGVIRKTFLIDGDGRIVRIWPKVNVLGHAQEVLQAARAL
jgi:thioredoxin-dependent peroxiredoxin